MGIIVQYTSLLGAINGAGTVAVYITICSDQPVRRDSESDGPRAGFVAVTVVDSPTWISWLALIPGEGRGRQLEWGRCRGGAEP